MKKTLRIASIIAIVYIVYIAFYNSYGNCFSDKINNILDEVYHTSNSLLIMSGFYILSKYNLYVPLTFISIVIALYNGLLSIFNILCIIKLNNASQWVESNILSGWSIFSIFVITLIIYIYGGFYKK